MNMRSFRRGVVALGFAAGLAGASTVAVLATIPDSGGVIHGCYQKNVGNLRVIDTSTDTCRPSEVAIDWKQTGVPGPQGPQGPQGVQGPQGSQGPQGAQGPSGLSHAYFTREGKSFLTGLPDGYYIISASVHVSFAPCTLCIGPPHVECDLRAGTQPFIDGTYVADPGQVEGANDIAVIPFNEAIQLADGSANQIGLRCFEDRSGYAQIYLTAIAVDQLDFS
jgi:hypothetical protein